MVCFFLSLLKRKLPQRCPKQGGWGGVKATFGQCPKGSSFFFRMTSLTRTEPHLFVETSSTFATCRAHCCYPVLGSAPVVFALVVCFHI